jgi:hypothetical protein
LEAIKFQNMLKSAWDEVATMKLVCCAVCGESLYTTDFKESLSGKLHHDVEALCPLHRQTAPLAVWEQLASNRGTQV